MQPSSKLNIKERTAVYSPGRERIEQILAAAGAILFEHGFAAVTLREVARRCDVRMGAITHYYASKSALMADLLDRTIAPYLDAIEAISSRHADPATALHQIVEHLVGDLASAKTVRLCTELWSSIDRDELARSLFERMYASAIGTIADLVLRIEPSRSPASARHIALQINAIIEGSLLFIGNGRPWHDDFDAMRPLIVETAMRLAKTGEPGSDGLSNSRCV